MNEIVKESLTDEDIGKTWVATLRASGARIVVSWDGKYLSSNSRNVLTDLWDAGDFCSFQPYISPLEAVSLNYQIGVIKEDYETLRKYTETYEKNNSELREELSRLKSHPYVMRRADKPDCVGLWRNVVGQICRVETESDLDGYGGCPPYYLLGPIPVVVEQQPPKVVKVREKETGVTADAIVGNIKGLYTLLSLDGKACSVVSVDNWEEVQS